MIRTCKGCGQKFETGGQNRYCDQCSRKSAVESSRKFRDCICESCGAKFIGRMNSKFCPACKSERKKKQKAATYQRMKTGTVRSVGSIDICERCGKEYVVAGGVQKFCPECGKERAREIMKLASAEHYLAHKGEIIERVMENRKNSAVCKWCGKPFTSKRNDFNTCSIECALNYRNFEHAQQQTDFSKWIYAARIKAGLSVRDLADRIGVAPNTVRSWEDGHRHPRIESFKKLQKIFGRIGEDENG